MTKEPHTEHIQDVAEIKSTHNSKFMVTEVIAKAGDEVLNNKINLLMSKDGTFKVTFDGVGVIDEIHFSVGDIIGYGDVMLSIGTLKEFETELFTTNTTYILEKSTISL